ncbi:MAG: phosphate ABC transporter substrate-binding protein PstS [Chitinispirillaceae bacterium]|nr:phosphate ABC transporter substrate-binding protein PstS [Chitinispirillaceae bacterium]
MNKRCTVWRALAVSLVSLSLVSAGSVKEITGAGATFPYPVYAKWAEAYKTLNGTKLNYQSIGSGGGIKQITAKTVDFGASDKPLTQDKLKAEGLLQWPMIMGGVVPVINVKGIGPGNMKLTGTVLADIYLGKIKKWNDPAIAELNKGLNLPKQAIAVVHRSDGSGTTFLFTNYLTKISKEWADKVGNNSSVEWPTGIGGKGNEGVANFTAQTPGAVGYVEYAYALQNKLSYTLLSTREGTFVSPTSKTFQAAAGNADWANAPGFYLVLTDQPGKESWPITGASFILMHKKQDKPDHAKAALAFFEWCYAEGGKMAEELDYIPMPESVVKIVKEKWAGITSSKGTSVYPGK